MSTYDFNIYLVFSKVLSKLRDLLRFYIKIEKTEQIFSRVKLTVRLFQSMPQLFKSLHQNDLKHNQASITNVSKHSIFVIGLYSFKYRLDMTKNQAYFQHHHWFLAKVHTEIEAANAFDSKVPKCPKSKAFW